MNDKNKDKLLSLKKQLKELEEQEKINKEIKETKLKINKLKINKIKSIFLIK